MPDSTYKRIDHAVYRAERALVVASLLIMAIVVFLDVVHRSFSGNESKFAIAVAKLSGWVGIEIVEDTPQYEQLISASPWVLTTIFVGLAYFGIRSAKRDEPVPPGKAIIGAVAGVLATYGLVRLLLVVVPNGIIWSQPFALVLTLWVGFIGASMCTYENRHLKVEAVQRHLPESVRPIVGFISGALTTVVCLVLLWLSIRYVRFNYQEYVVTDGKGGLFLGMDMPKYMGFAALPLAFGFMAIRFSVKALAALRGEFEEPADPLGGAGPISEPDDQGRMPSEVATEAHVPPGFVKKKSSEDRQESAIDTMTSRSGMVRDQAVPRPQSKVPTDVHPTLPRELQLGDERGELHVDPAQTREVEEGPIQFIEDMKSGGDGDDGEGEDDDSDAEDDDR